MIGTKPNNHFGQRFDKPVLSAVQPFDKLRANGVKGLQSERGLEPLNIPFVLSLSKERTARREQRDKRN
jgi:hypothetical protein